MNLPPLPNPVCNSVHGLHLFDAMQMHQYAVRYAESCNADLLQVLRMVDTNNRIDEGEPIKAWRGSFVVSEVRRVVSEWDGRNATPDDKEG